MRTIIAFAAICLAGTFGEGTARDPKLFFVTTATSAAVSTSTTSVLQTCLMQITKIKDACTQRKKRSVTVDDHFVTLDKQKPVVKDITRVSRDLDETKVESVPSSMEGAKREPKFAWYYMTTTVTTISTSTAVSTTYTGTLTITIDKCTPSSYIACG